MMHTKKVILCILVILICILVCILALESCSPKHEIYDIKTNLGDSLSVKVYLTGNLHGLHLAYELSGEGLSGLAYFCMRDEYLTEIPENSIDSFTTIGSFGDTNFYTLQNELIYVYDNTRIGLLDSDYDLDEYKSNIECHSEEYMGIRRAAMSDIIKSNRFDYIYQYGEILAYEENEDIKQLLQRYVEGNFSDEELSVNEDSARTTEEMMLWANNLLERYFTS